ncbi:MAG: riboflavin biosynthesis protein RibF [Coriobacteriia bacterium]|nr:riboflavin biosynthesis protein RibF [Coriobacteriia bacterium]
MSAIVRYWDPEMPSLGPAVTCIGVFDGVHVGHQALIRATVSAAELAGARPVAVTFDRDPDQVLTPESAAPQLLPVDDKLAFIADLGARTVLVVPFDEYVSRMTPERFLARVVLASMEPLTVMVGEDFRFGHRARGDLQTLRLFGQSHRFEVVGHELVRVGGEPVTSTRIRNLVAEGDVSQARRLLGRPHRVRGVVEHGRGDGSSRLGTPTANLRPVEHAALPAEGVYAGRVRLEDRTYAAGISVGHPPTFPDSRHVLEAALVGFSGGLYGRTLTLEFLERLRDLHAFEAEADLADALRDDLERAGEVAEEGEGPD